MIPKTQKIPVKVSDYITDHFKEDFLFEVTDVKKVGGRVYYIVEVSKDNYITTLKFNDAGDLVQEESNKAFQEDAHDEPEEIPE